jgi:hypothetical protein
MTIDNPSLQAILFASARASVRFALQCLEPYNGHLRPTSSFVKPDGEIMHWHDFGDLAGPGWAANAVGGAHLLWRWGRYLGDAGVQDRALALLDHVLEDGFIESDTGFIRPYYELAQERCCLNYVHQDDWLCPGSLAKIGVQMLAFADELERVGEVESGGEGELANGESAHGESAHGESRLALDVSRFTFDAPRSTQYAPRSTHHAPRIAAMRDAVRKLAAWLFAHTPLLSNGWVPRRITPDGQPFPLTPHGQPDPIFDHSADGLFLLELAVELTAAGLTDCKAEALALGDAFVAAGGFWGSINHDTYDDHESVAYSCAFRILRAAADLFSRPAWREFAYAVALPALARFRMAEDRNGVATTGLLWMEETWDTAYLWENAEAAQAYLDAWGETGDDAHRDVALGILRAIANHHYGDMGFLTEGVDWNNHVSQRHHIDQALYGAIQYTEPLLNNLHFLGPTLFYFRKIGYRSPEALDDAAAIALLAETGATARRRARD